MTYLSLKTNNTTKHQNQQPITSLPKTQEILIGILIERIYQFLGTNNIIPEKQRDGSKEKSEGILWLQRSIADQQDVVGKLLLKKVIIFT